jgi:hypothetical protein
MATSGAGRITRPTRRGALTMACLIVLVAVVAVVLVERGQAATGRPVHATPPSSVPATAAVVKHTGHTRLCTSTDGLGDPSGTGRTWLDRDPTGATLLWLPGFNARPCRAALTHLDASGARALAEAVDSTRPFPNGSFSCPADDESAVTAFLSYRHARSEVVRIRLAGCGGVHAPARDARWLSDAVRHALGPAPAGW